MRYFIVFLLTMLFLPSLAQAQLTPTDALKDLTDTISVAINPENPGPNTAVTVAIESYSTDLDSAEITWTVGGKTVESGVGQKTLTLQTGLAGTTTTINVLIQPIDGSQFQKIITITPASVDILWQSDSYTPPFYEGKSLFAKQNNITFVALPNIIDQSGNTVAPQDLIYTWSNDGSVLGSLSGTGKNSLTLTDSIIGLPMTISVVTSTIDKSVIAENSIVLQSGEPMILFYEKNPLYGTLYNQALGNNLDLTSPEISVAGAPFYFPSGDEASGALSYTWSLNGAAINSPNQNFVTLRQQSGVTGQANLGLEIQDPNNILQTAQGSLGIQFSNQNNS